MKDHKEDGSKQARTRKHFPRLRNGGTNVCNRPGLGASKIESPDFPDAPALPDQRQRRPPELAGQQVRRCAQ